MIKKFNENFEEDFEEEKSQPEKELYKSIFGKNPNHGLEDWDDAADVEDEDLDIKGLDEYTDEEKIKKFDELYGLAEKMLDDFRNSDRGEPDEDDDHYTWEAVMNLLARDKIKFWKYYRSLY